MGLPILDLLSLAVGVLSLGLGFGGYYVLYRHLQKSALDSQANTLNLQGEIVSLQQGTFQAVRKVDEFFGRLIVATEKKDEKFVGALNSIEQALEQSQLARQAADETHTKALESAIGLYASVDSSLRELRSKAVRGQGGSVTDTCGICSNPTTSYFIDGAGKTVCHTCKPDGFVDAVRRGTAKV